VCFRPPARQNRFRPPFKATYGAGADADGRRGLLAIDALCEAPNVDVNSRDEEEFVGFRGRPSTPQSAATLLAPFIERVRLSG
jgi:hypothetical protein